MPVLISVIIPTYNRAELLKKTLGSLIIQPYAHFEILVIDDGGNDHTKEIVLEFGDPRIKYYWKENAERGAARNYGAKLAKGEYLNFFDSDDTAYENHLQTAANHIQSNPGVVTFHTSYDRKAPDMEKRFGIAVYTGKLNDRIFKNNILSCNNVFIRKNEFDALKFSEDRKLVCGEDWLLWIRICSRYPMEGLPEVTSTILEHRMRSMNSTSGDDILLVANILSENLYQDRMLTGTSRSIPDYANAEMRFLASLYYAIEGEKKKCISCFFTSVRLRPSVIYSRRTLAIVKYLFIK